LLPGRLADDSTHLDEQAFAPACSLTDNGSAQFECRWIRLAVHESTCIFTQSEKQYIELPVAHGEGRFVLADPATLTRLQTHGQIPLMYTYSMAIGNIEAKAQSVLYPDNPNGSIGNIAGICNARGNVLGLMPHPERYVNTLQHPLRRGTENGEGDGLLIFKNAYEYTRKREKVAL
jgi:phosphoribosylformylglycinamidine (FGAM) synthase-like amidotransferase family enzyme